MENIQISLKAARVNAGMTQEEVAKAMHISKQTIINWEKGKTTPAIADIEMISKLYKISRENIFLPIKLT